MRAGERMGLPTEGGRLKRGYFATAWRDVRESKGWVRNLLLLSLVSLVPVFGPSVVLGYAYGWARDIAWGVRTPMPPRIRPCKGDRLYLRGFHLFVLSAVFVLLPFLAFSAIGMLVDGLTLDWIPWHPPVAVSLEQVLDTVVMVLCYVAELIVIPFILVGWMRVTIYGRLSAGFQISRIWNMMRYRLSGLLRIAGILLVLVAAVLLAVLLWALALGLVSLVYAVGVLMTGGGFDFNALVSGVVPMAAATSPAIIFPCVILTTFAHLIIARALGYWTAQFDVPHWQGQDDPMPFERGRGPQQTERPAAVR